MSAAATISPDALFAADLLSSGLSGWGIELSETDRVAFAKYAELLVDWNSNRFNLTRLTSPEQIALNHFLDSLVLTQIVKIPAGSSMIDIGTGAGFPGLAFKILRRDIKLVLVESTAKKLLFCQTVASTLGLANTEFVHGRAEDAAVVRRYGQIAGLVTARAVAPLKLLLEWTAPLIGPAGVLVAWKGPKVHEEIVAAKQTADRLGLKMELIERSLKLKDTSAVQHFYVVCRAK